MPINPDDLRRELGVAEPGPRRLSLPRRAGSRADVRLRSRFLPWLGDQTARGTHAARAFWSALEPDERERLWNILQNFRAERRAELRALDKREVGQIAGFVYGGLVAARQAWRDPNARRK